MFFFLMYILLKHFTDVWVLYVLTWKFCGFPSLSWMHVFSLDLWKKSVPVSIRPLTTVWMCVCHTWNYDTLPLLVSKTKRLQTEYLFAFGFILVLTVELPGWSSAYSPSSRWNASAATSASLSVMCAHIYSYLTSPICIVYSGSPTTKLQGLISFFVSMEPPWWDDVGLRVVPRG